MTGLEPGHQYKFRVTAVNDEGDSEPLEAERAILAKNPFGKLAFMMILQNILQKIPKYQFVKVEGFAYVQMPVFIKNYS